MKWLSGPTYKPVENFPNLILSEPWYAMIIFISVKLKENYTKVVLVYCIIKSYREKNWTQTNTFFLIERILRFERALTEEKRHFLTWLKIYLSTSKTEIHQKPEISWKRIQFVNISFSDSITVFTIKRFWKSFVCIDCCCCLFFFLSYWIRNLQRLPAVFLRFANIYIRNLTFIYTN